MGKKLYVGGLPYSTTKDRLREAFAAHGRVVSADVVVDRETGRSRGFGFVEMSSEEEASKATRALNGSDLDGRQISVSEAKTRDNRSSGRPGGSRSGGRPSGGRGGGSRPGSGSSGSGRTSGGRSGGRSSGSRPRGGGSGGSRSSGGRSGGRSSGDRGGGSRSSGGRNRS